MPEFQLCLALGDTFAEGLMGRLFVHDHTLEQKLDLSCVS